MVYIQLDQKSCTATIKEVIVEEKSNTLLIGIVGIAVLGMMMFKKKL